MVRVDDSLARDRGSIIGHVADNRNPQNCFEELIILFIKRVFM